MSTDPCTAITKAGTLCGKTVGTQPTPDGPRCFNHAPAACDSRPKTRPKPPLTHPRTTQDAITLSAWALGQAAAGNISAPMCNAVGAICRVFLKLLESDAEKQIAALFGVM